MQTVRFALIQQPVRLVRPKERSALRFAASPGARQRIETAQRALARVA